jgi:two-component system OmpR family response regulator
MDRYQILAVDDDLASRLLLQKSLKNDSYHVAVCESGEKAIQLIRKEKYDLVITDLIMEGIGGLELLGEIKKIAPDLSLILLTGHASIETAIEAVRLGASDYLLKPINVDELGFRVKKALEQIELQRKLKDAQRNLTYSATIATANHEINQPLTVIISAIDMIRMEIEKMHLKNDRLDNYLELLTKSSLRIANLLRKLREITSPKMQEIPYGVTMIDIDVGDLGVKDRYVLVVEDEENLRQIIHEVLDSASYKVILAETAKEAIDLFRGDKELIEAVILDFNLPDSDGLSVLRDLQKIDPTVKILLTSGFDVEDSITEALKLGALDFVRKPFNRRQILSALEMVYSYHAKDQAKTSSK